MGEDARTPRSYSPCAGPQRHRDHLCHLMEKGLTEEVRRRSDRPAFVCANCGAQANAAEDLCNPHPLRPQGGRGEGG